MTTDAALFDTYGLQAVVNDDNPLFVQDNSPLSERHYRARFYFDPNSIAIPDGDSLVLFEGRDLAAGTVFQVNLSYFDDAYQVEVSLVDDSQTSYETGWSTITDEPHALEMEWMAASDVESSDGLIRLWVDGEWVGSAEWIATGALRVDYVRLGVLSPSSANISGTLYIDDFASQRDDYIGLDGQEQRSFQLDNPGEATQGGPGENAAISTPAVMPTFTSTPTPTPTRAFSATPTPTRMATSAPTSTSTPRPSTTPAFTPGFSTQETVQPKTTPASTRLPAPKNARTMGALAVHTGVVTQTIDYTYDPLYRLTSADYSGGDSYSYTYDAVGNRLSQDDIVGGLPTSLAYTYDIANRLTAVGSVSYTWDANGNLLNDGTNTYAYDSANRLKAVSGGQTAVSYTYNGLGNRLQQTANSTTITYVNDLNAGLTQVLSDGTNTYLYGNVRIAQLPAGDPQKADYFLGDALGSVRQMADETGAVVYAASFDPYGEVLSTNGDVQTSYGYAGENTDSYIKLIDLRSRQYSPSTGTFLTRDSWQGDYNRPQSLDRWAYTEGNPINFADPSGFSIESDYGISLSGTWPNYGITSVHEGVEAVGDRLRSVLGGSSASAFRLVYYRGVSFQWDTNCFNCRQNTEAHPCIDTNDFGQIDPDCKPGGAATLSSSSIMFASTWKLSPITARNLVVHELGHVFSRILSSSTANYGNNGAGDILYRGVWQGNWAKLNCNDDWPNRWKTAYGPNYGFASDGVNDLTWQLHFMQDQGLYAANEEFADMFLGWVFNKWETDASNSLTYAGGMRSDWMNHWMPIWLRFITVSRSYANEN